MSKQRAYITTYHKGQTDYVLPERLNNIGNVVMSDGRSVKFEVVIRLEEVPEKHGQLTVFEKE